MSEQSSTSLWRELRLTPELWAFAEQNSDDSALIHSLARIFTVLNDDILKALGRQITEKPELEANGSTSSIELHENPFFMGHTDFVNQNVIENYVILKSLIGGDLLSEFDFGILSYLLRDIPRSSRPISVDIKDHSARHARAAARLKELLKIKIYRHAIEEMLRSPEGRTQFLAIMNLRRSTQSYPPRILNENDLDGLIKKVAAGNMNEKPLYLVKLYLCDLTYRVLKHASGIGHPLSDPNVDLIDRQKFFEVFEDYYAQKMQIKSSLSDIKDLYDYLEFGSPLPLKVETLKTQLFSEARKLLFPLKNRFADVANIKMQQEQLREGPALPAPTTAYVEKDFFAPPPTSKKTSRLNADAIFERERKKLSRKRSPLSGPCDHLRELWAILRPI